MDSVKTEDTGEDIKPLWLPDVAPKTEDDVKPPLLLSSPSTPKLEGGSTPPTPAPGVAPNGKIKRSSPPQLIGHLPRAEDAAFLTFTEIHDNHYQYGTLGRSREAYESMTCDCQFDPGVDSPSDACGHGSDCINRLTQVECLPDDCRCRAFCQNQRFQRKEYANIDIVLTEKKGFGLRAACDLIKDTFIYEYVGDVVSHPSFMKRMRDYAMEGIKHFYFMMLQKDEYIDATKRGGIGRFANHSCNPNCYVAKWTVGSHVRMGIFANRNIQKDEELTFNYNVDRYGHEAQPCYCGEPNCVGFLGGKTQTDIAAMDDLYLDALGITDEVESLGLKGSKKRKSKKLDEDYMPILKPLVEKDIPKLIQAMRQTQSRKVLFKLLTRIKITEDQPALRQLMRLRGFSVMTNILEDHAKDLDITTVALECMVNWPLIQRNKVDDSKVKIPVQVCAESDNETVKALAQKLLDHWDTLEYAYRIPKRLVANGEEEVPEPPPATVPDANDEESRPFKKFRNNDFNEVPTLNIKPLGFRNVFVPRNADSHSISSPVPAAATVTADDIKRSEIAKIIAAAAAAAEKLASQPVDVAETSKKPALAKPPRKHQTKEEKETNKEKRLLKLVGAVVVKCMSKYSKQMNHDLFKKHAQELTHIIAEKEKKSSSYKDNKLDNLSDEKVVKIKKFAKEYITKVLRKLEKSKHTSSFSAYSSISTPASTSATDIDRFNIPEQLAPLPGDIVEMDIQQDIYANSDSEDGNDDTEMNGVHADDTRPSPGEGVADEEVPPDSVTPSDTTQTSDPRLRHRNEETGWDPDGVQAMEGSML